MATSSSLAEAISALQRRYGAAAVRRGGDPVPAGVWASGLPVLDRMLAGGGLPLGRVAVLAGQSAPPAPGPLAARRPVTPLPAPLAAPLAYASSLTLGCTPLAWQEAHGDVVGLRVRLDVLKSKVGAPGASSAALLRYPRPHAVGDVVGLPMLLPGHGWEGEGEAAQQERQDAAAAGEAHLPALAG